MMQLEIDYAKLFQNEDEEECQNYPWVVKKPSAVIMLNRIGNPGTRKRLVQDRYDIDI